MANAALPLLITPPPTQIRVSLLATVVIDEAVMATVPLPCALLVVPMASMGAAGSAPR